MTGFFTRYDRFLSTSIVGSWPVRLNARYEAIIAANAGRLAGARVLDIASHDGRWSFAALAAGAESVVGVEARGELVDAANANMKGLGIAAHRYRFERGDLFDRGDLFAERFDLVLCLGILYHTARQAELLHLIRETQAPAVIIDTHLINKPGSYCLVRSEAIDNPGYGYGERGAHAGKILVHSPTAGAVELMLRHFGYAVSRTDWETLIGRLQLNPDRTRGANRDNPVGDYARRERGTFLATLNG